MGESIDVSIGDLIEELDSPGMLKVVSQTRPSLNAGSMKCRENGEPYITPGGTISYPIRVIGRIAIAEVISGHLGWSRQEPDSEYAGRLRHFLEDQQADGPIAYLPRKVHTP